MKKIIVAVLFIALIPLLAFAWERPDPKTVRPGLDKVRLLVARTFWYNGKKVYFPDVRKIAWEKGKAQKIHVEEKFYPVEGQEPILISCNKMMNWWDDSVPACLSKYEAN